MNLLIKKQVELNELIHLKYIAKQNKLYSWFLNMKDIDIKSVIIDLELRENLLREEIKSLSS